MKKKLLTTLLTLAATLSLCACTNETGTAASTTGEGTNASGSAAPVELNIAYQYGLAYAPAIVCMNKGFIEEAYKEATGGEVTVNWTQMSSGADINTGIASGSLDVGFVGVGPAISGVAKNVGYRIFTNLSGQEHGLMTSDPDIKSLGDLAGSTEQIALVNTGSFQHIILGKALADNGYDAHMLDSNIVAMKHPDGMTALESGSLNFHLTSSPYIFKERDNSALHEIPEVNAAWPASNSFILGVASIDLHDNRAELYKALCDGMTKSIDYLNNNLEDVAQMTSEFDGNTPEAELEYLKKGVYTPDTKGIFELASFMSENGFVESTFSSYSDLVFDNVKGD